jgi:hypothetical protein
MMAMNVAGSCRESTVGKKTLCTKEIESRANPLPQSGWNGWSLDMWCETRPLGDDRVRSNVFVAGKCPNSQQFTIDLRNRNYH